MSDAYLQKTINKEIHSYKTDENVLGVKHSIVPDDNELFENNQNVLIRTNSMVMPETASFSSFSKFDLKRITAASGTIPEFNTSLRTVLDLVANEQGKKTKEFIEFQESVKALIDNHSILNLINCNQAAATYHMKHHGFFSTSKERKMYAKIIEVETSKLILEKDFSDEKLGAEEPVFSKRFETKEARAAYFKEHNPKKYSSFRRYPRLREQYGDYCLGIDADELLTPLEKAEKKVQFFRANEAVLALGFESEKKDPDWLYLKERYDVLEKSISALKLVNDTDKFSSKLKEKIQQIRENDITSSEFQYHKKTVDKNLDDSLTKEQLEAINDIDKWLLRNTNNGGLLGVIPAMHTDTSLLVSELLSMTKRERLNIYYLIQTKERKNPTFISLYNAQNSTVPFVPSLKEFKNQMIASKLKIITHLTGGYVYWDKIGEAMRITRRQASQISNVIGNREELEKKCLELTEQKKKEIEKESNQKNQQKEQKLTEAEVDKALLDFAIMLNKIAVLEKIGVKNEEKKKEIEDQYNRLMEENGNVLGGIDHWYQNSENIKNVLGASKTIATTTKFANKIKLLGKMTSVFNKLNTPMGYASIGGAALTGALGIAGAIVNFVQSGSEMNVDALCDNIAEVFSQVTNLGWDIANTAYVSTQMEKSFDAIEAMGKSDAVTIAGVIAGGAIFMHGAYQLTAGAFASSDITELKKDIEITEKLYGNTKEGEKEVRYQKCMANMSQRLAKRNKIRGAFNMGVGALTVATALTGGALSIVLLVAGLGLGIGASVADSKQTTNAQTALFDEYYQMDSLYEAAYNEYKEKWNDEKMEVSDKAKERLKDSVRKRVMLELGYSTITDANAVICRNIATKIMDYIKNKPENPSIKELKQFEAYITIIGSLGLKWEDDGSKPSVENLARKLSGR